MTLLTHHAPERRAVLQILHQVVDAAEMPAQQRLLLRRRTRALRALCSDLAGAPLVAPAAAGLGHGGLWHEVEVEELDELQLHLTRGGAGLEERGDGQEAVEGLEGTGVARGVDECGYEGEEGGRLDGGAVDRLEEVEEELEKAILLVSGHGWEDGVKKKKRKKKGGARGEGTHVHVLLSREEHLARWMQQQHPLD